MALGEPVATAALYLRQGQCNNRHQTRPEITRYTRAGGRGRGARAGNWPATPPNKGMTRLRPRGRDGSFAGMPKEYDRPRRRTTAEPPKSRPAETAPHEARPMNTLPLLLAAGLSAAPSLTPDAVRQAPARVVAAGGAATPAAVRVVRDWSGPLCRSRLVNDGPAPVRVQEVVLFDVPHALPPETALYGEGFTMLSQTGGTLGHPADLG